MRRILIAVAVVLVAWFLLKDSAYSALLGNAERTPVEPDYFYDDVWLDRPSEETPGGWETPWGVDLFVIAPPVSSPARKGALPAESDELRSDYDGFSGDLGLGDADYAIYAPAYRSPSPASGGKLRRAEIEQAARDVASAMKRYVSADNRERGLIILAAPDSVPLLKAALEEVPNDEAFRQRFGGVIVSQEAAIGDNEIGPCSPAFDTCLAMSSLDAVEPSTRYILPSLPRPHLSYSADLDFAANIETRAEALSNWLDNNAVKPAEPFDTWAADEVVDVAPIRRPNQDEDISGERGD